MKKVSVIIPVYNSSKHIIECLDSVIKQTFKNLEIILVDDNSTDNSLDIIKSYKDKRIKIIELKENVGAARSRNKGVEVATGDYICFIDSDDFWKLNKIEKQVRFINNKEFIYAGYSYYKKGRTHNVKVPKQINYNESLKNTTIFTSTVMFNMNKLTKEDIYMPDIKRGQDQATWWKVLKKGINAYGIDEVLAFYRVGEKSLSSNKLKALKRTWYILKREELGRTKTLYCYMCYIKNAIKRRL